MEVSFLDYLGALLILALLACAIIIIINLIKMINRWKN